MPLGVPITLFLVKNYQILVTRIAEIDVMYTKTKNNIM